jgi:hypothetical protein
MSSNEPANNEETRQESCEVREPVPTESKIFAEPNRERAESMEIGFHGVMLDQREVYSKRASGTPRTG